MAAPKGRAWSQLATGPALEVPLLPMRAASKAKEATPIPLTSLAKEMHQVKAACAARAPPMVVKSVGLYACASNGALQARRLAATGLIAIPQHVQTFGRK